MTLSLIPSALAISFVSVVLPAPNGPLSARILGFASKIFLAISVISFLVNILLAMVGNLNKKYVLVKLRHLE